MELLDLDKMGLQLLDETDREQSKSVLATFSIPYDDASASKVKILDS